MARLSFIAFLALTGLLLAACSPANKTADTTSATASAPSRLQTFPYPPSDFISEGKGRSGGTLRVSLGTDPQGLDNHVALAGAVWGRLICDFLVYVDEKGGIAPYLAKSWDISPDGKTYTFHLRDDVTFSDGEKFNAAAVLANLSRIQDPATKGALSTAMLEPYLSGRVIDAFTFEATLRRPYGFFLHALATNWFAMLSPKAIRENPAGLNEKPIGTGPFVVESYDRNQRVRFVRRPDYAWAPPLIQHTGPAYLDAVEFDFVPEPLIRYTSLASSQHDMTLELAPQTAASVRADPHLVLQNRINAGNPWRGPIFNTEKPPFDDVRIRRALAKAVDREGIAQVVGFGEYLAKADFLSSNGPYYDPSFKDVLAYDPSAANRLLDEAGWTSRDAEGYRTKNGERLSAVVHLNQNETTVVLVAIQSDAKKIGLDLKLEQVPSAQRLALVNDNKYQAMRPSFAYNGNSPDALNIHYHSSQINTGKFIGQNAARLRDTELDTLLDQARATRDPAEWKTLYRRVQQRLVELVPAVPLYENQALIAYQSYVKGVVFDTSSNRVSFTTIWLDR